MLIESFAGYRSMSLVIAVLLEDRQCCGVQKQWACHSVTGAGAQCQHLKVTVLVNMIHLCRKETKYINNLNKRVGCASSLISQWVQYLIYNESSLDMMRWIYTINISTLHGKEMSLERK